MTEVLLFNIEKTKAIKIKNLCRQIHISAREVDRGDYGVRLSALLGMSSDRTAVPDSGFDGEMLYFAEFNGGLLNIFLNQLRSDCSFSVFSASRSASMKGSRSPALSGSREP